MLKIPDDMTVFDLSCDYPNSVKLIDTDVPKSLNNGGEPG